MLKTRGYDFRYAPTGIALSGGQFAWTYATDANGNVLSISDGTGGGGDRSFGYQEWQQYLTTATGPWGFRYWSYDRIGNRTRQNWLLSHPYTYVRNPLGGNTPLLESVRLGNELPLSTRFYTFDAGGFLTQTAVIAPFRNPEPPAHLTFDAAGTLTDLSAGGKPLTFGYDGRGLLVRAGMGDTPYALPTYSSEGRLYSLQTIDLTGLQAGEIRTGLLYFAGRPVAQWREAVGGAGGGALTFLTTDHLGTPACALGEDASVTWSGGFEPFGRDWQEGSAQSALANGIFLRLPGQWDHPFWHRAPQPYGSGADLYYNVHRWYESSVGRYVSVDPMLRSGAFPEWIDEAYRYGRSNPIAWIDPLGLAPSSGFECCDCPGETWSYTGVSASIGVLFWGWSSFTGTFTCDSNGLKVEVDGECSLRGLMFMGGIQGDLSPTRIFIPGARACMIPDLFDDTTAIGASGPKMKAKVGVGVGASTGPKNTGMISGGLSAGGGIYGSQCRVRPYRPLIDL